MWIRAENYGSGCSCIKLLCTALVVVITTAGAASGVSYTGTLTTPATSGLDGLGVWADGNSSRSWTGNKDVSAPNWHYSYSLTVQHGLGSSISHIILEVSDGFGPEDLIDSDWPGPELLESPVSVSSGNPGMLEDLSAGIRFDESPEVDTISWTFESPRQPVWGDFFAIGGNDSNSDFRNALWNFGFTLNDTDPPDGASDGSVNFHLLVPDTLFGELPPIIPEPITTLSTLCGLVGVGRYIRRRKRP